MNNYRRASAYVLAYVLWAASLILGALAVYNIRETVLSILAIVTLNRTQGNVTEQFYAGLQTRAADVWSWVVVGFLMVILVVFLEFFYRTAIQTGKLWARFFLVTATACGFLFLTSMTNLLLRRMVGAFSWVGLLAPGLSLLGTAAFLGSWFFIRRQKSPVES